MTDRHIIRQSSSYRQGLVLGLTMAEIMLLLVFCLLIAFAAYVRFEATKFASASPSQDHISQADQAVLAAIKKNSTLYEKVLAAVRVSNGSEKTSTGATLSQIKQPRPRFESAAYLLINLDKSSRRLTLSMRKA